MAILVRRRRAFAIAGRAIVLTLLAATRLSAQAETIVEDDIKAAFLYNFAKYVEWPETAFPTGAFRVCVVADAAFVKKVDTPLPAKPSRAAR
jgi:hypothetical protein